MWSFTVIFVFFPKKKLHINFVTSCFMTSWYRQNCLRPGLVEFMSILAMIFSQIYYLKCDEKNV